jgi:hypothetical protein
VNIVARDDLLATGHCPYCKHHLFVGKFATSDEALQKAKKLKRDIRGHLRFAVAAWGVGLVPLYAIVLWWASSVRDIREINWFATLLVPPAISVAIIGMLWFASRSSIGRAERLASVMEDLDRNGST